MFRFADSTWLLGLAVLPLLALLFWIGARRRRGALRQLGDLELVQRLTATVHVGARRWKAVLLVAAVGLSVVALARPQFGTRVETVKSVGQDIMVALDVSQSMLAEDVQPSRLDRARLAVMSLIGKLHGDRIGLVAFAGDAFVQCPLTVDYAAAEMFLNSMGPDKMPVQGTDLGAALRVSLDALDKAAREERVVVIFTDGEDQEGDFENQLTRAAKEGVHVHVVGVGSTEGVPIPQYDDQGRRTGFLKDSEGKVVTTRLNQQTLQTVAERTGAKYVRIGEGGAAFDDLVDELAGATGETADERQVTQFDEQYQIFLGVGVALLALEWLLPERRRNDVSWAGRFE
jgi:Ca-activated chloride channel homolog